MQRIHIALATRDLDRAVAFYTRLFGVGPVKRRADYAKFLPDAPSVNLSLSSHASPAAVPAPLHFGIEVDAASLADLVGRVAPDRAPDRTTCCYAEKDEVRITDPDGNPWELYTVVADTDERGDVAACCAEDCCP